MAKHNHTQNDSLNHTVTRRQCLRLVSASAVGAGLLLSARSGAQALAGAAESVDVIKVVAQKFKFTPNDIVLRRGHPSVLEFTALDFVHGFNLPDLKLRQDLMPGKVTRLELKLDKVGVYEFVCDNFCGDGHEEMHGKITVLA